MGKGIYIVLTAGHWALCLLSAWCIFTGNLALAFLAFAHAVAILWGRDRLADGGDRG